MYGAQGLTSDTESLAPSQFQKLNH